MSTPVATRAVDCRCTLGEGLVWDPRRRAWLWTDIEASVIWQYDPVDGSTRQYELPDRVGSFAVCTSGRLLVGVAKGLAVVDPDQAEGAALSAAVVVPVEADEPSTRVNDGRPDRSGRFVFGTYNERSDQPIAAFYQYSTRDGLRRLDLGAVAVANSICFSPDGRTMYFCDSATRRIMRCTYDSERATVSDIRLFAALAADGSMPDGSTVDADGGVWNAEWGGSAVRRYDASGQVTDVITIPEPNVTCPTFGGVDLDDLLVTTARAWLSPDQLRDDPAAGGLYRAPRTGRRGLADTPVDDPPAA